MVQRLPLIAALVIVEFVIVGGIFIAIRGAAPAPWSGHRQAWRHGADGVRGDDAGSSRTFATSDHPALTIDVGQADVEIVTRATPNVAVAVRNSGFHPLMGTLPPIVSTADGDAVRIATEKGRFEPFGDDRIITVMVPASTHVTVENAGNISASGLRAETSLNSGNGNITVDDFNAPALHVTASNGRLVLHAIVAPQLDATSSNGRVEATGLLVRDGRIDSSNGRISLGFATGADTIVTAASSNGEIKVSGLAAPARVSRGAGNDDDNDAADDDAGGGSGTKTVRIGAGAGRLDVRASNGNIHLSQEG